jgi:hypothetical protein
MSGRAWYIASSRNCRADLPLSWLGYKHASWQLTNQDSNFTVCGCWLAGNSLAIVDHTGRQLISCRFPVVILCQGSQRPTEARTRMRLLYGPGMPVGLDYSLY